MSRIRTSLALLFALLLAAPGVTAAPFAGRIVFEQSAKGGPGEKAFNGLAASKVTVHIGTDGYRQDENGGINEGSVIIRTGSKAALKLNHKKKTSERGGGTRLDDMDAKMKAFMPQHFKSELKATPDTATIAGHPTRKFEVIKSAFVRQGATAHVWIAEDLDIGKHRYNFEFEFSRVTAPIPLSIPVDKGTILKAEILENGTLVTIVASEVAKGEPKADLLTKPADYEGPDFPAPAKNLPAPAKPAVDTSSLAPTIKNGVGMTLVLIKPGTFTMGSPADEPNRHDNETQQPGCW